jgi:hypothetical protein
MVIFLSAIIGPTATERYFPNGSYTKRSQIIRQYIAILLFPNSEKETRIPLLSLFHINWGVPLIEYSCIKATCCFGSGYALLLLTLRVASCCGVNASIPHANTNDMRPLRGQNILGQYIF